VGLALKWQCINSYGDFRPVVDVGALYDEKEVTLIFVY
jgi:hypothetical protein